MNHLPRKPAVGGTPIIESAPMAKAPIVQGMRRPMPSMLADLVNMGGGVNGSGGKEERDLRDGVRGDMERGADDRDRRESADAENDIGKLANRRVGEPAFQIVLPERDQRCDDER